MENIKRLFATLNLPVTFTEEFFKEAELIEISKKDFFVKQNSICQYVGIVESGSLFAYFENENADVLVNELYQSGSFITSYRSFLTQIDSPGNIQAYTNSKIYVINNNQYKNLLAYPNWVYFFKSLSDTLFFNKCTKETALIKLQANERYKELIVNKPNIEQIFPQYLIASYLKIKPETLSRIKSLDIHQHQNLK